MKVLKLKQLVVFSLLLLMLLTTAGCTDPVEDVLDEEPIDEEPVDGTLADEQILKIGSAFGDLNSGDPNDHSGIPSYIIMEATHNHLMRYEPGTFDLDTLEGDLAEDWEISEDGLTLTMYLREGVQFQHGFGELTADDVVYTFERAMDLGLRFSEYLGSVNSVEAVDDYTVNIHLDNPDPTLVSLNLGQRHSYIISKEAYEHYDIYEEGPTKPEHIVGTGPFMVEEWVSGEEVVLVPFEEYFRGKPILERIEFKFIPDNSARLMAFLTEEVHMVDTRADVKEWAEMILEEGKVLDFINPGGATFLFLDLTQEPTSDIRVRQAIAHALDMQSFVDEMAPEGTDYYEVPIGFMTSNVFGYNEDLEPYEYDPEKARQLLEDAGYPDGFKHTMYMSPLGHWINPITYVQNQLKKVGIEIEFEMVDNPTFIQYTVSEGRNRPITYLSESQQPDPSRAYERNFLPGTPRHEWTNYNSESTDLIIEAASTYDLEKRREIYKELHRMFHEDLPVVGVSYVPGIFARQPYVDLGYEYKASFTNFYTVNEKTRILTE